MSSIELQQLMVINKRNQLGWQIKLKSLLLDLSSAILIKFSLAQS